MCRTNNHTQYEASSIPINNEPLDRQSTYHFDGKRFIVTPVFRSNGSETLGSVLLKLMQTETAP